MKLPFSRTIQQAIKNKQQKQQINRYIINNHWYFKPDIVTMFNAEFEQMAEQLRFKLCDVTQLGDDVRLRLIPSQETL